MDTKVRSKTAFTPDNARKLLGKSPPVLADGVELSSITSAIMKRSFEILRENFPGQAINPGSDIFAQYMGIAQSIASDELATYITNAETGKPMKNGAELRHWRSSAVGAISVAARAAEKKVVIKKKRGRPRKVVTELTEDDELNAASRAVKTEVRIPPRRDPAPKVYNARMVNRAAGILADIADKHEWLPPDTMVSLLTGYPLINCRLARERLYDRGYYLQEGRNGAWRVLGRPTPTKAQRPPQNGLYTAEEVAKLLEKVRKGEL